MLRINLLPGYVTQRRKVKSAIVLWVIVLALCFFGPMAVYVGMRTHQKDLEAQATDAETKQKATQDLRTLAVSTIAQIAPIQADLNFVKLVHDYNREWAALYAVLAQYTDPNMIYTDAATNGAIMTIKAHSPSVAEVGRYLQAIYKEPDFKTVSIDKLPGYPENVLSKVYLGSKLIGIIDQNGGTGGSSGGSSSYGGSGGGSSQTSGQNSRYGQAVVGGGGQNGSSGGSSYGGSSSYGGGSSSSSYGGSSSSSYGSGGSSSGGFGSAYGSGASAYGSSGGQNGGTDATGALLATAASLPSGIKLDTAFLSTAINQRISQQVTPFSPPDMAQRITAAVIRDAARRVRIVPAPKDFDLTVTAELKNPLTPPAAPGAPAIPAGPGGSGGYPGSGYPGSGGRG